MDGRVCYFFPLQGPFCSLSKWGVDKGTIESANKLHYSLPLHLNLLEQGNSFKLYHPLPYPPLPSCIIPFFTFLKQLVEHNVRGRGINT